MSLQVQKIDSMRWRNRRVQFAGEPASGVTLVTDQVSPRHAGERASSLIATSRSSCLGEVGASALGVPVGRDIGLRSPRIPSDWRCRPGRMTENAPLGRRLKWAAMAVGWVVFGVGLASGLAFRWRGLAVPFVYEVAVWVGKDLSGDLVNHSGNGDNLAAEAALAGTLGFLLGVIGVLAGNGLSLLLRRRPHVG